ncbi:MAG: hypothetical protein ACLGI5_12085 [Thermoleophilia bacterium]
MARGVEVVGDDHERDSRPLAHRGDEVADARRSDASSIDGGWSAITSRGAPAGARANATRWRWPPGSSCGKRLAKSAAGAGPTSSSAAVAEPYYRTVPLRTFGTLAVGPSDADLGALVCSRAAEHGVGQRDLRLQALLHLPRLADEDGCVTSNAAAEELARRAEQMLAATAGFAHWAARPTPAPMKPSELRVIRADEALARPLLERFHYLRSFRESSTHVVGALDGDRPVAVLSFSPFDLAPLEAALPDGVAAGEVLMLSRVFAFDWAPHNTITYLLRRALNVARDQYPSARLVLTYVNPNLGFSAASYRAGNWTSFAREHGTRYAYVDGEYVTDRYLAAAFGTSDPTRLADRLGDRFAVSRMSLAPLDLYALALDRRLRSALEARPPLDVARPTP